jgi:hypothetical protein
MKFKILLMFLALPIASCAYLISYTPQVTLQTNLSDVIHSRNLVITNATGYYAELTVNCQVIGVMKPGDTFYSKNLLYDFTDGQAAVTLTFWKSADKHGFIGAAGQSFYNNASGNVWIIHSDDIVSKGNYSSSRRFKAINPGTYEFSFPRIIWHSTTLIQIVNDTPHRGIISLNGQRRKAIDEGDTYCAQITQSGVFANEYDPINIVILFSNGKTYNDTAYSYPNQEQVKAIVITNYKLSS